jgi:hypothetical protein
MPRGRTPAVDYSNKKLAAPGEWVEAELDSFIQREARKRQEELGEDPGKARANAEWAALEAEALARAEERAEANVHSWKTWLTCLSKMYLLRHEEWVWRKVLA